MDKLIVATHNRGKLREIKQFFCGLPVKIVSADELGENSPRETGKTYRENALLKARYLYDKYQIPTLADDSGLEVKILNGLPGVHSARFDGPKATYESNNIKLLSMLGNKSDRRAQFISVIILLSDTVYQSIGKVSGRIAYNLSGVGGFGYDPLFIPLGYQKTYSELACKKRFISHRAIALKKIKKIIEKL